VRAGDSVGRLGGDEFVVISETVRRPADLRDLAARIIAAIGTPIPLRIEADEVAAIVGVSIGIATDHDGFTSAADLISSADAALYRAKAWRLGGAVFADEADPLPEARAADNAFQPFAPAAASRGGQSADQ
jgi:diguanylate cyclase (GGDEF)-like protein